jgi:hypothetical protein
MIGGFELEEELKSKLSKFMRLTWVYSIADVFASVLEEVSRLHKQCTGRLLYKLKPISLETIRTS